MKIETKYNLGDIVYLIGNNKVFSADITGIRIIETTSKCDWSKQITYHITGNGLPQNCERREENLFSTKEELLKSL